MITQRTEARSGGPGVPKVIATSIELISIHELIHELLATHASAARFGARRARPHP
jgi:hypothetical protein